MARKMVKPMPCVSTGSSRPKAESVNSSDGTGRRHQSDDARRDQQAAGHVNEVVEADRHGRDADESIENRQWQEKSAASLEACGVDRAWLDSSQGPAACRPRTSPRPETSKSQSP